MLDNSESHGELDVAGNVDLSSGFNIDDFFNSSSPSGEPSPVAPEPESDEGQEEPSEQPAEQEEGTNEEPSINEPVSEGEQESEIDLDSLETLTYTVNGESRQFEGISVLPDGAIVDRDALPKLMQRLSERDNLFERNQELYKQHKSLENLTKYKVGEQEFSGVDGVRELRTRLAQAEAIGSILLGVVRDPSKAIELWSTDPENGELVANQKYLSYLESEYKLAAMLAKESTAKELDQLANYREPVTASDYSKHAPQITDHFVGQLGFSNTFSATDKSILSAALPQYLRPFDPKIDDPSLKDEPLVVDAGFGALVRDLAAERGRSVQASVSAAKVTQENQARMKGVLAGKAPSKQNLPPRDKQGKFREDTRRQKVTDALDNGEWPTYN